MNYRSIFEATPIPTAVLAPTDGYPILAVNDAFLRASFTSRDQLLGQHLVDMFPERPDTDVDGAENLLESLRRVAKWEKLDVMAVQRWDVRDLEGEWLVRYWRPINLPVFVGGELAYILHHVEDVTAQVYVTGRKV